VPYWDEWLFVSLLREFDQGTVGFSTLFAQHNEHRMPFPRLLMLANAALFHWNRTAEMYVSAVLLILCAWLLFRFARAYWAHPLAPVLFVPMAWLLLSWRQWENLLMGMGTVFTLAETGVILALLLLHRTRRGDRFVWGASAAAFMAGFSSGGGLFLWPVGLGQLLLRRLYGAPGERPGPGPFVVWTGAGTLTCALFFYGYNPLTLTWPSGFMYLLHSPLHTVRYLATFIGSPLSCDQPAAQSLGILMTALAAWAVFLLLRANRDLVAASPLLAFMAFTVITAVAACDRRMGEGIGEALASRYCSLTGLGIAAVYILWIRLALTERRPATLLGCGGMTAFVVLAATNFVSWNHDSRHRDVALEIYAVRNADVVSDEPLAQSFWIPGTVRDEVPYLRAHGYSLFHHAAPAGVPPRYKGESTGCNIDLPSRRAPAVNDVQRGDGSSGLRVYGWAVDLTTRQTASQVFVNVDGRTDFPALLGRPRPDVYRAFGNLKYSEAGFISYIRTSRLSDGEHALELKVVSHDGSGYWTCNDARIRVVE
jgi:hypothetical protein